MEPNEVMKRFKVLKSLGQAKDKVHHLMFLTVDSLEMHLTVLSKVSSSLLIVIYSKYVYFSEPFPVWASILIVLFSLTIIAAIVSFYVYRRLKLEAELNDNWWKIKWEDINFPENLKGHKSATSMGSSTDGFTSTLGKSQASGKTSSLKDTSILNSLVSAGANMDGILVGTYKGIRVAVKPITVKKLHISRQMLIELKQVF